MSTYEQDQKVRPSATWYLLPVAIWIGCIVLAVIAFRPFIDLVKAGIDPVSNGSQVSVPTDGLTVYGTNGNGSRSCQLVDSSGSATQLDQFDADIHVNPPDDRDYYALASTPDGLSGGRYNLQCDQSGPRSQLGIGDRLDVGALGKRLALGIIVPLVAGLIGLAIVIVLLVKRHNSKSRIRTARAQAASGYPGGWPPASGGGYPPPPPPPPPPSS